MRVSKDGLKKVITVRGNTTTWVKMISCDAGLKNELYDSRWGLEWALFV